MPSSTRPPPTDFPTYTAPEAGADRVIHLIGVPAGVAAAAWLILCLVPHGTARQVVAAGLYGTGLIAMLAASAAYNLVAPGHAKALLRRLDHAMIFVMIAGSYTPFALCALPPSLGYPLLVAAWTVAAVGVGLRMAVGNRYRAGFVALYLVHGWMVVAVLRSVAASVQPGALALLVAGGVVYSVGALIMTRERWPFHNAIWHAMVLLAAGLHLGAVAEVLGVG